MLAVRELELLREEVIGELVAASLAADCDPAHRRRVARLLHRIDRALEAGESSPAAFERRRYRIAADLGLTANGTRPRANRGAQRMSAGARPTNAAAPSVLGAAR